MSDDPARLAVWNALLASAAEEMGVTLWRTGHSPNIRERRDFSCAVFDAHGEMVAQAAHIPVHLGAMPESVAAVSALAPWSEGDVAIVNDPYLGGTHLPDTLPPCAPVFAARRAHRLRREPGAPRRHRRMSQAPCPSPPSCTRRA